MDLIKSLMSGDDSIPGHETKTSTTTPQQQQTQPPTKQPPKPPVYYIKLFIFAFLWIVGPLAVVLVGLPALILLHLNQHTYYRGYMRQIERAMGSLVVITGYLFLPGSWLVLTGDFDQMRSHKKNVVFANHQVYPDWFYLWLVSWAKHCHGDFRVMMIKVLKMLPVMGQGMQLLEFIFVNQNAELDRPLIAENLQTARKDRNLPLWMLIFPEGGLNWKGGMEKSRKYAEKVGIAVHPEHCILPRSTGLFWTIENLQPNTTDVFDLTVGYSGVSADQIPYDVLSPNKVFLEDQYPREVHVHVRKFHVASIPGFKSTELELQEEDRRATFDTWLRGVWMEKDNRLKEFYEYGELRMYANEPRQRIPLIPHSEDWMYFVGLLIALDMVFPLYIGAIYWSVVFVFRLGYLVVLGLLSLFGFSRLSLFMALMIFLGMDGGQEAAMEVLNG